MKTRIRKLDDNDIQDLEKINNYRAKIIIEELESYKNDKPDEVRLDSYIAYGVFNGFELIGFCSLSHSDEFDSYSGWDDNSKAISELYLDNRYSDNLDIYCELFNYILYDEDNLTSNIYFDNNINLSKEYYEQLGFSSMKDGTLIRISNNNDNINMKEER